MKNNKNLMFSKKIQQICKSRFSIGPKQVIDDMVQLTYNFMTRPIVMNCFPLTRYYVDDSLLAEVRRYEHDPETWKIMQELVIDFIKAYKDAAPFTDVIGSLYDEYLGEVLGQFLTPSDVADALAGIQVAFMPKPTEKTLMGDHCGCGAGSLILGMLRTMLRTHGADSLQHLEVHVMDLDANMVRLCSVQVMMSALMHKIPLSGFLAFCGNTITDYSKNDTLALEWHPMMSKMDYFESAPEVAAMRNIMQRLAEEPKKAA
jgi:hypothetical protein